jgi:hypothetical protein
MQPLAENVIQGGERVVFPFYLKGKTLRLSQRTFPVILCIKVSGIGITLLVDQGLVVVGLYKSVVMGGHKAFSHQSGFSFQNSQRQAVEPHNEVSLRAIHYLVV